jgi:uncharacterized protein YgiM (DUF1202 family)
LWFYLKLAEGIFFFQVEWRKSMKRTFAVFLLVLLSALILAACQTSGEGPRSWIDQPLGKKTFPLQPLTLQAHASDQDGVESIEFSVEEDVVSSVGVGGHRLGQAAIQWTPPGLGTYTIYVCAKDINGNIGMKASSEITITGDVAQIQAPEPEQQIAEEEQEPEQEAAEEEEEEEIQVAEEPPEEEPEPVAMATKNGNCRSGPSADYELIAILLKNQKAPIVGRSADNFWFVITPPDSNTSCWIAASLVTVEGELNGIGIWQPLPPPEEPPEEEPPEEAPPPPPPPPPPEDTTPPTITSVSVSRSVIYQNYCSGYDQTTVLTVQAYDDGGIASAEAVWVIEGEFGTVILNYVGASRYQGLFGPVNDSGSMHIYGSVIDNAGNWTPFDIYVTVLCCVC